MTEGDTPSLTCPSCGQEARGNFCRHCGASLGGRFCNQCGHELAADDAFCNQCGAPTSRGGRGEGGAPKPEGARDPTTAPAPSRRQAAREVVGGSNLPWWIAGAALFGLILAVGWSTVRPAGSGQAASGAGTPSGGAPAGPAASTDISQMTPREAADRLFNRVMTTISQGDTAGAMAFQPMAVQAYVRAEPLDRDGLFHQALLELMAEPEAALVTIQRILDEEPDHILALGVAANASVSLDRPDAAAGYYQQILDAYAVEADRPLSEYEAHRVLVEDYRAQAREYLGQG